MSIRTPKSANGRVVTRYAYHDAAGGLLATHLRLDPKSFRWDPKGIKSNDLPLYRLSEVRDAVRERRDIWIPEGEKDVETLRALGLCATTAPGEWRPQHTEELRTAFVIVCADRDDDGERKAQDKMRALRNVAADVRLRYPIEGYKDVTEHLEAGYSLDELVEIKQSRSALVAMSGTVPTRSIRWIWRGLLARGYMTSQTGIEEVGKTSFACWMISKLSRGELSGDPQRTLVIATEDGIADTWRPRLILSGHDPSMVGFLELERLPGWNVRDGIENLRAAVAEVRADVVVFDALLDHFPPAAKGESANSPTFVRNALLPLKMLTRELDIATLFSMHPSKGKFASFRDTVQMSQAFRAIVRLGLLFANHPDDDEADQARRRVMIRSKGNVGRDPGAREFVIVRADFRHDDGIVDEVGYVRDVRPSAITRRDLIEREKVRRQTKIETAMDIIRLELSDGEWRPCGPIREKLEAEGIVSNDTVNEATVRLRVEKSNTIEKGPHAPWFWRLPRESEPPVESRNEQNSDSPTLSRARVLHPDSDSLPQNTLNSLYLRRESESRRFGTKPARAADSEAPFGRESESEKTTRARAREPVGTVTLDIETDTTRACTARLGLVVVRDDAGLIEELWHPQDAERVQWWLDRPERLLAHNASFDFEVLANHGYRLPDPTCWDDLKITAWIAGRQRELALEKIVRDLNGPDALTDKKAIEKWIAAEKSRRTRSASLNGHVAVAPTFLDAPRELLVRRCRWDVENTARLDAHFSTKIGDGQRATRELERRVLPAVFAIQRRGAPIDIERLCILETELIDATSQALARVHELGDGCNPNAPHSIADALRTQGVDLDSLPRTPSGKPSVSKESLVKVGNELAMAIIAYKREDKIRMAILGAKGVKANVVGGRVYGNFNAQGTNTGRFSSSNPNLQNWHRVGGDPRPRSLIRASEGNVLVVCDLEAVQMRIMGYVCGDGRLLRTLLAGERSIHEVTGESLDVDKQTGKFLNFSMSYGIGYAKLAIKLEVPFAEAKRIKDGFYETYPEIRRRERILSKQARRDGYVETPLGRRIVVPERQDYCALNYLVQAIEADLVKTAIVELHAAGVPIVLTIHDEVVAECLPERATEVGELIVTALTRSIPEFKAVVPLEAEYHVGNCWADLKE